MAAGSMGRESGAAAAPLLYSLTPAGRRVLESQRNTWKNFVEAMGLIAEWTMPDPSNGSATPRADSRGDWTPDLRARLAQLRLSPAREAEIVEELSQHLDDRYEELRAAGPVMPTRPGSSSRSSASSGRTRDNGCKRCRRRTRHRPSSQGS